MLFTLEKYRCNLAALAGQFITCLCAFLEIIANFTEGLAASKYSCCANHLMGAEN